MTNKSQKDEGSKKILQCHRGYFKTLDHRKQEAINDKDTSGLRGGRRAIEQGERECENDGMDQRVHGGHNLRFGPKPTTMVFWDLVG